MSPRKKLRNHCLPERLLIGIIGHLQITSAALSEIRTGRFNPVRRRRNDFFNNGLAVIAPVFRNGNVEFFIGERKRDKHRFSVYPRKGFSSEYDFFRNNSQRRFYKDGRL